LHAHRRHRRDRRLHDSDRRRDPEGASAAGGLILSAIATLVGRLPAGAGARLGRGLGGLAFVALPARRRVALTNLAQAFPALSPAERRRIGRRSFQHFGVLFVELAATLARPLERTLATLHLEGLEHLRGVMATHGRALALPLAQQASRRGRVVVPVSGVGASTCWRLGLPARRTPTSVAPIVSRRQGHRRRVAIHPPRSPPSVTDVLRAVVELTMRCTAA